jgi:hypothetical protein
MASKAKVGRGTVVSIGGVTGGTTTTFTPIEELMDASFSGAAWGTDETSNFDSGVNEEFVATMRNNGEVSLKGNLVDGAVGQTALSAACDTGSKFDFTIVLAKGPGETTKGTSYAFSAITLSFLNIGITTKGIVQFDAKLKVSGAIITTVGA